MYFQAIFHQSIDDMLQEVADSPDSKFLPLELVTSTDLLRVRSLIQLINLQFLCLLILTI
jgi:hypothetical protein